jgi:son of sevenless-like protein
MPVTEHTGPAYDFLAEDNYPRWYQLLQPFLRGVLHEVHPHLDIDNDALTYLEKLLYQLLQKISSTSPGQVQDVKVYVQENYPHPVNEWAIQEAEGSMDKISTRRKKGPYALPLDKIHHQLIREVLGHKVDVSVTCFILGVLDYVAADALKLAGNFMKNTRDRSQDNPRGGVIQERDLRVSINVDQALSDLFELDSDHEHGLIMEPPDSSDPQSMKHEDYVKQFNSEEVKYLRHLNMLIKIYKDTLGKQPQMFSDKEIDILFGNIDDVYELTLQLYGMVEDCLEMVGDGGDQSKGRCPQLGACFLELAMNDEFSVYSQYSEHIHVALAVLKKISKTPHMDKLAVLRPNVPLFKEAVMYVLPTHLLQPIYHCLYYFDIIQALMKTTTDDDDRENFSEVHFAFSLT